MELVFAMEVAVGKARKQGQGYTPALWEKITVVVVSVGIVLLVGWLVLRNQRFADPNLVVILRIIISLAVAVLGATIPGFLQFDWKGQGAVIRAGGALALFIVTYLLSPSVVKVAKRLGDGLPQAATEAKDGWEKGTTIVLEVLRDQARRYPEKLSIRLKIPQEDLGHLSTEKKEKARQAHKAIFDEFEQEAHQKFLSQGADPRVVNPRMRQYFADVRVKYSDGSTVSMDEATRSGRQMHERLFELILEAVLRGEEPLSDGAVSKQLDDYLDRRQAVTEAIEEYLAQPG
jgi:hypothetical protein